MKSRAWIALLLLPVLLAACGDPEVAGGARAGGSPSAEVPERLDVVCREDGSTEITNREVRAQADGVHVRVDNRAGEFVSLNGVALDFSEGITEQEAHTPPGEVKIACWPGSKHREPEPERHAVQVLDPDGYWVPYELECPNDDAIGSTIIDYDSGSHGTEGDPEDIGRADMKGLEEGDEFITVGYPKAAPRVVAIERGEETVALLDYSAADKGGWYLGGYSACPSSGITS